MLTENEYKQDAKIVVPRFSGVLFLGFCVIAIAILIAGNIIANRLPSTLHGNFHGSLHSANTHVPEDREFMNEWQAANFLGLWHEDLIQLIDSGELAGTYTTFHVYRQDWSFGIDRYELISSMRDDNGTTAERPIEVREPERLATTQRIFSRDQLTKWMNNRINMQQHNP